MCYSSAHTRDSTISANNVLMVSPSLLMKTVTKVSLNGREMDGLIDSDSTGSYIHPRVVEHYFLKVYHSNKTVSMASASSLVERTGYCQENLQVNGCNYRVHLGILLECCTD